MGSMKLFEDYCYDLMNHNDLEKLQEIDNCLINLSVICKQLFDEYEKENGLDYYNPLYGDIQYVISSWNNRVVLRKGELRKENK